MNNISKEDISEQNTPFKSAHTASQASKLTPSLNLNL